MENQEDDTEEINEKKIKNKDILSEEELLNSIDMTPYSKRIENIIGRQYSNVFFNYFESIYKSKIKNKISAPLSDFLNIANNSGHSLWMHVYKTIKFYSKDNLPILISKYFCSKAEYEFKFIFNESKKYTKNPNKFINIYIIKMKKINNKKLTESKAKNIRLDIFDPSSRRTNFIRSFLPKKTILRTRITNGRLTKKFDEVKANSIVTEEEIKNKKIRRIEIMRQVHQIKMNAIKEIEKYNVLQRKQRKKYGAIKSRFLDVFKKQQLMAKIINFKSSRTANKNLFKNSSLNLYNSSKKDDDYFPYYQRKKSSNNNSKLSRFFSRDNIYTKSNTKIFLDYKNSKTNNFFINTNKSNSPHKIKKNFRTGLLGNNKPLNLKEYSKNKSNKIALFKLNLNNKNIVSNEYDECNPLSCSNKYKNKKNKLTSFGNFSYRGNIKRSKSGLSKKKDDTKSFIDKLEQKRNKEFLETFIYRNNNKDNYNNKIYELFKRTDCF